MSADVPFEVPVAAESGWDEEPGVEACVQTVGWQLHWALQTHHIGHSEQVVAYGSIWESQPAVPECVECDGGCEGQRNYQII